MQVDLPEEQQLDALNPQGLIGADADARPPIRCPITIIIVR